MPNQPEPIPPLEPTLSPLVEVQQSAIELAAFAETASLFARDLADRATAHLISTVQGGQPDPRHLVRDQHRLVLCMDSLNAAERVLNGTLRAYTVDLGTVPRASVPVALNQPQHLVAGLLTASEWVRRACSSGGRRIDRLGRGVQALTVDLLRLAEKRPLTDEDLADLDAAIAELSQRHVELGLALHSLYGARDALRPPRVAQSDDDTPEETPAAQSLPPADATLTDAEQGERGVL